MGGCNGEKLCVRGSNIEDMEVKRENGVIRIGNGFKRGGTGVGGGRGTISGVKVRKRIR